MRNMECGILREEKEGIELSRGERLFQTSLRSVHIFDDDNFKGPENHLFIIVLLSMRSN